MGHAPPHWEGVGRIPSQGVPQDNGEEKSEREERHGGIPLTGGHDGGGGTAGGGGLNLLTP